MTPDQQALLDRAVAHLSADKRIEALWLAGSLGRGVGDAWSDVDLLACCAEGMAGDLSRDLLVGIDAIAPTLLVNPLFGGRVINIIADGWQRFDISLIEAPELGRYDRAWLTALFNRSGVQPTGKYPESYVTSPQALLSLVNEFLRVLGLATVGVGRGEYVLLMAGCDLLRRMVIDLMLEENGIGPWARGGALSRVRLLTDEQNATLLGLPPLAPTRESTLAGHVALARIFLPRARALAGTIGAEWPVRFEQATLAHLNQALGLTL